MSRLEKVIEQVKQTRRIHPSWINENGSIKDGVIVGDVVPFLEELREYEIGVTDDFIRRFKCDRNTLNLYTYNWNANVDKDIAIWYREDCPVCIVNIHLMGDARIMWNTDFAVKMPGYDAVSTIMNLESAMQSIYISDRYVADVDLFSETYTVYDYETDTDMGGFTEIEVEDLLKEITKQEVA